MVSLSSSSGRTVTPVNDILQHGLYLFFTNQFSAAQKYYTDNGQYDVRLNLLNCFVLVINAISTHGSADMSSALDYIWNVNSLGSNMSSSWSNTYLHQQQGNLLQADCHLLAGCIQLIQESYVKAIWNIRKSYKLIQSVHNSLSTYTCNTDDIDELGRYTDVLGWSQFEYGYVNLLLSLLPAKLLTVVSYIGFNDISGTNGLLALNKAVKANCFVSDFAALMLINYYVNIKSFVGVQTSDDIELAESLITAGQSRFNNQSVIYLVLYSRLLRCKKQLVPAIDVAKSSLNYCCELPALFVLFYYQIGWCSFFMLDWGESEQYFNLLLTPTYIDTNSNTIVSPDTISIHNVPGNIRVSNPPKAAANAFYAYHAGLCCALNQQYTSMNKYLSRVPIYLQKKSNTKPIELYAKKRTDTLIELYRQHQYDLTQFHTLTVLLNACELMYVWNGLTQMSNDTIQQLYDMLKSEQMKYTDDMNELQAYQVQFYDAVLCALLDQPTQSLNTLIQLDHQLNDQYATLHRYDQYTLLYTMCSYELALQSKNIDPTSDITTYLKQCNKYDGFLLYNMLQIKIHAVEKQ